MKKPSPIIKLAATGIAVILILQFSEVNVMVEEHVAGLTVYGQISETTTAAAQPTPEFDKILSKFSAKSSTLSPKPDKTSQEVSMDELFKKGEDPATSAEAAKQAGPSEQDMTRYEAAVSGSAITEISTRVTLQAVTPTGAVIGGTFVEKGQKVPSARYSGVQGEVTPVLKVVTSNYAILEYPDKTTLKLYLSSPF